MQIFWLFGLIERKCKFVHDIFSFGCTVYFLLFSFSFSLSLSLVLSLSLSLSHTQPHPYTPHPFTHTHPPTYTHPHPHTHLHTYSHLCLLSDRNNRVMNFYRRRVCVFVSLLKFVLLVHYIDYKRNIFIFNLPRLNFRCFSTM